MMNWMERMIRMRKETAEVGWGDFQILPSRRNDVLILRFESGGRSVVTIHNFSADPVDLHFRLDRADQQQQVLINQISDDHSRPEPDGRHCVLLEPYGYRWFRVSPHDPDPRPSA
jgi:maltose alpha-D-glucosyltransferase/alpha-amylase